MTYSFSPSLLVFAQVRKMHTLSLKNILQISLEEKCCIFKRLWQKPQHLASEKPRFQRTKKHNYFPHGKYDVLVAGPENNNLSAYLKELQVAQGPEMSENAFVWSCSLQKEQKSKSSFCTLFRGPSCMTFRYPEA